MSTRTRENRLNKPGAAAVHRPARDDRRQEHRKVRRAAHMELAQLVEPENHALPRPVHTSVKADPAERPAAEVQGRRFKVWKTKGWKRRNRARAERANALADLRRSL